jgi:hypothetical protein
LQAQANISKWEATKDSSGDASMPDLGEDGDQVCAKHVGRFLESFSFMFFFSAAK